MRIALDWDAKRSSKPKISNLQGVSGVVNKEILGLEISMEDSMGVAVVDSSHQLVCEFLGVGHSRSGGLVSRCLQSLVEWLVCYPP